MTVNDRKTLHTVALEAGLRVPTDPATNSWDSYPHFELFCASHLHTEVPNKEAMLANARLIAALPAEDVDMITKNKLIKMGFIVAKQPTNGE